MSAQSPQDQSDTQDKKQTKYPKRSFWMKFLLIAVMLFGALIGYLKLRYSPKRCVDQFITALESQDYQTLKSFISCEGVEVTEDSLKPLVDLCHANHQFMHDIKNTLNRDLSLVNLDTYNNSSWVQLISHRKFLIKTYTIQIQPIKVTLATNLSPVTVTYSNQSQLIESPDATTNLLLMPGLYQFDAAYTDTFRKKEVNLSHTQELYSDQSVDLDVDCSTLILDIPDGYQISTLFIDGKDLSDSITITNGAIQCYPVFTNEVITLTCNNSWGENVTTSFSVPEEYVNQTYHHICDFSSTSMEFSYEPGLTVTELRMNGKKLPNLDQYINEEDHTILLSDLTDGTVIETHLKSLWGERFVDTYTISADNFDEYKHLIDCYLSKETQDTILDYAYNYYCNLFKALNSDDMDTLAEYADDDEMANDFYVMLENIQYEYDTYSDEIPDFSEDIVLQPSEVYADRNQVKIYSDVMELNLIGVVKTTTTSLDDESPNSKVETSDTLYNVTLHLNYDTTTKSWTVTAGYYNYDNTNLVDPVKLD